jgi:hypothetical protein
LLARGINIQYEQRVGVREGGGELIHQVASSGVAVRLKDHVNLAIAALSGRRERCANLGGMVAIVVDDCDTSNLAAQLETPVDSAKVFKRLANVRDGNVESDADGYGGGCIQDVMQSRNVQAESAEIGAAIGDLE